MPKTTIHRLLSALLVASFVPVASAQVPRSLTERNAKLLLPGVFGTTESETGGDAGQPDAVPDADTDTDTDVDVSGNADADSDAPRHGDAPKAGGGEEPEQDTDGRESDRENVDVSTGVHVAAEPPLPGQRRSPRARTRSYKGHAKGAAAKKSGKKSGKNSGKSSKNSAKDSGKNSGKNSAKNSGKNSVKNSAKDSGKNSGKNSAKNSAKKPAKTSAKNSGKNSAKKPAKKSVKTSAKKSAKKRRKGAKECDFRTPIYEHEVAKGEHLGAIAGRYGVRRSDVIALNTSLKKNPDLLRPGQKLRICPELAPRTRKSIEHRVVKGENPTKIAKHYGLTVDELLRLQKGKLRQRLSKNPRSLRIGDQLVVMIDVEEHLEFAPREHHRGILRASTQLTLGSKFYLVKRPNLAYGTPRTIRAIKAAVSRYKQRRPKSPRVHIGDISKRGGGRLKPHKSHQKGVDVDIGLVHKGILAGEKRFVAANAQTLDVGRTWALIKAFADTNEVRAIFLDYNVQKTLYEYARHKGVSDETLDELFQYPRGRGRAHGLVRHWRGHRNHFHVRFRG